MAPRIDENTGKTSWVADPRIDYTSDPDWIIAYGVPVLDEHELVVRGDPAKGTADRVVKITAAVLAEIARNNNRAVLETGDLVPLVEGHTRDGVPESEQPEILGYADDFSVGPLFQTGRACLLSRWRISKDPEKLKKAKNLPRRSVELWLDRKEINPISLLGATAPERNLGLLRLMRMAHRFVAPDRRVRYRQAATPIHFQYPASALQSQVQPPMPMPTPDAGQPPPATQTDANCPPVDQNLVAALVPAVVAALQQTDVWQKMVAMTSQPTVPTPADAGGMGGGLPGMGGGMEGGAGMAGGMGGGDPIQALLAQLSGGGMGGGGKEKEKPREDEEKVPMQAGGGFPGGTPYIPGQSLDGQPPLSSMTSDRTPSVPRMRMGRTAAELMRAGETPEQALVRLAQAYDEAVRLARTYQIANELHVLVEQDRLVLDPAEEAERLLPLDDAARRKEYDRMRLRYQRSDGRSAGAGRVVGQPALPGQVAVPGPAVGQQLPTGQQQSTPQAQDAPMTREEHDACLRLVDEGVVPTNVPNPMGQALRLLRSGLLYRGNGRVPERVY